MTFSTRSEYEAFKQRRTATLARREVARRDLDTPRPSTPRERTRAYEPAVGAILLVLVAIVVWSFAWTAIVGR